MFIHLGVILHLDLETKTQEGRRVLFQRSSGCRREAQGCDSANMYWHY